MGATLALSISSAGCDRSGNAGEQAQVEETTPSVTSTAPTTIPTSSINAATCKDMTGEGKPADIRSVAIRRDSDQLMVQFKLTARPPRAGTVLFSINASSPNGDRALQLGVKYLDGQQIAYFVFPGTGPQRNLPGSASLNGTLLTATFPYDAVAVLGETWKWAGNTNVEGRDVDDCPNAGADTLNTKKVTFPA